MFLKNLKYILFTVLKTYGLILIIYFVLNIVDEFFPSIDFSGVETETTKGKFDSLNKILYFALNTLILAPILEELVFREPLKQKIKGNIILCIVLGISIILTIIKYSFLFSAFAVYSSLLLLINYLEINKKWLLLTYTSLFFGAFHIINFQIVDDSPSYLYLYKIFPLTIIGFMLGVIRLKLNVFWSMLGHFFFNLISFIFNLYFNSS